MGSASYWWPRHRVTDATTGQAIGAIAGSGSVAERRAAALVLHRRAREILDAMRAGAALGDDAAADCLRYLRDLGVSPR